MSLPLVVLALSMAQPLAAQDGPRPPEASRDVGRWEPLGPIPVDQAGAGRRGYVLPGEGADLADPGANQISLHAVAANDFYHEENGGFAISQRGETHTVALGYRRGFSVGRLPRFELGGQVQLSQSDGGVLNGLIRGVEDFWGSLTGSQSSRIRSRIAPAALPLGTVITRDGRPVYQSPGRESGIGDISFTAKALLVDAEPASRRARVAARLAVNVSGSAAFTEGNFAGVGLSVDKKIAEWAALHGDVRAQIILDRQSAWGLPLRRGSVAFSVGPELRLTRTSSVGLQFDGGTTPYLPTGTAAFDENYGDITLGLTHRFDVGRRHLVTHLYARENMNLPFNVRWNTDPDLAIGLKIAIR